MASTTEEKLQQMSDKVDATDKERETNINKDMEERKKRYDTVNEKLESLETRMDTMGKDQAESSCAIQPKLDALLSNSIAQDKLVVVKSSETRVDFVEPHRKKRESTPLTRIDSTMASGGMRTAMKVGASNSTRTTCINATIKIDFEFLRFFEGFPGFAKIEGGSLKLDEDNRRVRITYGSTTGCHDVGQYLGNDEQDT